MKKNKKKFNKELFNKNLTGLKEFVDCICKCNLFLLPVFCFSKDAAVFGFIVMIFSLASLFIAAFFKSFKKDDLKVEVVDNEGK